MPWKVLTFFLALILIVLALSTCTRTVFFDFRNGLYIHEWTIAGVNVYRSEFESPLSNIYADLLSDSNSRTELTQAVRAMRLGASGGIAVRDDDLLDILGITENRDSDVKFTIGVTEMARYEQGVLDLRLPESTPFFDFVKELYGP